jgi:hypothetical protein
MNGEDERSRQGTPQGGMQPAAREAPKPAAGLNPFLAEAPPAVPAAPARRRGKPPPGIISAGGVDMARAHASNIRPAADTEGPRMETAKVVVSVETNPRRVQTMRNMEGLRPPGATGPSPWAQGGAEAVDKAALPSANVPRDAAAEQEKKKDKSGAFWLRLATVLVALLLLAGVVRRVRLYAQRNAEPPAPTPTGSPLIPPPLPDEPAAATAAPSGAAGVNGGGRAGGARPGEEVIDMDDPSGEPSPEHTARPIRVRPPQPPPPPKPTFTPIFELPGEKN